MRAIDLKIVTMATYYRNDNGLSTEVPEGLDFDEETMFRQLFNYRLNLKSIMSSPPQGEDPRVQALANIDDVRKSVAILTELKKTPEGKPMVLEDENFNYLVSRLKATRWPFVDEVILTFLDDIEHTPAMSKERIADAVEKLDDRDVIDTGAGEVRVPRDVAVRSLSEARNNGKHKVPARR